MKKKKIKDFIFLLRYMGCLFHIDEEITKCSLIIVVIEVLAIKVFFKRSIINFNFI